MKFCEICNKECIHIMNFCYTFKPNNYKTITLYLKVGECCDNLASHTYNIINYYQEPYSKINLIKHIKKLGRLKIFY